MKMVADVTETHNVIPSFVIQNLYDHKVLCSKFIVRANIEKHLW